VCVNCLAIQPPVKPDWVAHTVSFLANEGQYYAGQVISIQPKLSGSRFRVQGSKVTTD